ncbi:MAG: hypothetical protein K8S00_10700 [Bacteroidales bacterium]|nr:hypothetical protein [Bacteroidales bacterium]
MKRKYITVIISVVLLSVLFNTCKKESEDEAPPEVTLLNLIPADILGFNDAANLILPENSLFDDVNVPGGYAIREWWTPTNSQFILALVMDFSSHQDAMSSFLNMDSINGAISYSFADSAIIGEEYNIAGMVGFRMLCFVRNQYFAIIGCGTIDTTLKSPESIVITSLAEEIDNLMQSTIVKSTRILKNNATNFNDKLRFFNDFHKSSVTNTYSKGDFIKRNDIKHAGVVIGWIDLKFNFSVIGACGIDEQCYIYEAIVPCSKYEIKTYIDKIYLNSKADDTDFYSDGDIMAGGTIYLHFKCGIPIATKTIKLPFVTSELGDITNGDTLPPGGDISENKLPKYLGTITGCQCPNDSCITCTFDILLRDNDVSNLSEFLIIIEKIIKTVSAGAIPTFMEEKERTRVKPKDTTGPDPFQELRKVDGDDIGESHTSEAFKIEGT